jgi:dihydrofolate reductase
MPKLVVFNNQTLDGYFSGPNGDLAWAHAARPDPEWDAFVAGNASGQGTLLFGRVTYEMMASYWPTPAGAKDSPEVAEGMNRMAKVVFSRTLEKVSWSNTKLVKGGLVEEVRALKADPGAGITILGSGTLVTQLAPEGLIDEYQIVVHPVVLGAGRTMFEGVAKNLALKRTNLRAFGNGNVLLSFVPD